MEPSFLVLVREALKKWVFHVAPFKNKNRAKKAPGEKGILKRQISAVKCVTFKALPCFNCSTRTNKAPLMHHWDTGGRGMSENRGREMKQRDWTRGIVEKIMKGRDIDCSGNFKERREYGWIGRKGEEN